MQSLILASATGLGVVGGVCAVGLASAVKGIPPSLDPRVREIAAALPGSNCGVCGFPGCLGCAEAIAEGKVRESACLPGGREVAQRIAAILGCDAGSPGQTFIARVRCGGDCRVARSRSRYQGVRDCSAAALVQGGPKGCTHGCLGFGSCVPACPAGALSMSVGDLPLVDEERCTGCGRCLSACPRHLIELVPASARVWILCSLPHPNQEVKEICRLGCTGCGACVSACPRQAITVENGMPHVDFAQCDGCGKCLDPCPTYAIVLLRPEFTTGRRTGLAAGSGLSVEV